ncbi:MAG: hypothetical protein H0V33_07135, partial [Acidimicrobiia bacterium]|nr:hypothetical protein [Acidimicrobiia bacterium]
MDSQALERRTLEQKDRAELAAIVEAMGGKAGSRAKKADLVDQVLLLAGVVEPTESPAASTGTTPDLDLDPVADADDGDGEDGAHGDTGSAGGDEADEISGTTTGSPSPAPPASATGGRDRRPAPD